MTNAAFGILKHSVSSDQGNSRELSVNYVLLKNNTITFITLHSLCGWYGNLVRKKFTHKWLYAYSYFTGPYLLLASRYEDMNILYTHALAAGRLVVG